MKNRKWIGLVLLGTFSLGALQVQGALLGKSYLGGMYEFTKVNDVPAGQDDGLSMFGVMARSAVLDYLDLVSTGAFGGTGDVDVSAVSFGAQPYLPLGGDKLKVFGDFQVLWGKMDGLWASDDDFGYSAGGGAEFGLTDTLSVVGLASYHDLFNEDDITVSAAVVFWVTEKVMIEGGAGYAIDAEDISVNAGFAIGF
jgi:hypothetical protein